MIGLFKALGVVKTLAAVTVLTTATAFAAQAVLPAASNLGQAHATTAAANANPQAVTPETPVTPDVPDAADPASGKDVAAIQARLAANKARLLETLNGVLARLQANPKMNAHATAALLKVIDRITNGDTGLNRATNAVGGQGGSDTSTDPGQPTLPSQAQNRPGPGNPPSHP